MLSRVDIAKLDDIFDQSLVKVSMFGQSLVKIAKWLSVTQTTSGKRRILRKHQRFFIKRK